MEDIVYLRPTGINTFLECSAKYFFQEVEKVEVANKSYLAFGSSIHRTLEANYSQKVISKLDLPVEEAKEIFSTSYEDEFSRVDKSDLSSEESRIGKDQGINLIEKYQKEVAPRVIPLMVEQRIKVKFKHYNYGLAGTIDLFDVNGVLIDHKTTGKPITGTVPEGYKSQISAYAILEGATGREVKGARIDFLRRDIAAIRHIPVTIDREYFLNMFQTVGDSISKGVFIPNRNSYLCSKKYCKFYSECEKKFGGVVKQ